MSVFGYFLPFLSRMDLDKEARRLTRDLKTANVTYARKFLGDSYDRYKHLVFLGQIADTADRFTSVIGGLTETIASFFGIAPGFILNAGEETIELLFKAPFFASLQRTGHMDKVYGLMAREAVTFGLPVIGDAYDVLTNRYVKTAYEVIREDARNRMKVNRLEEMV